MDGGEGPEVQEAGRAAVGLQTPEFTGVTREQPDGTVSQNAGRPTGSGFLGSDFPFPKARSSRFRVFGIQLPVSQNAGRPLGSGVLGSDLHLWSTWGRMGVGLPVVGA